MGFRVSYVLFNGGPEALMDALDWHETGVSEEMPDTESWAARVIDGWTVLFLEDEGYVFREANRLAATSRLGSVVSVQVSETVMTSQSVSYENGAQSWSVLWMGEDGFKPENLKVTGDTPPDTHEIIQRATAAAQANSGVDHMFDIPVTLAARQGGFRYDTWLEPKQVDRFRLVSLRTASIPLKRRGILSRLFGGNT